MRHGRRDRSEADPFDDVQRPDELDHVDVKARQR
jgi:hypothetical protein